MKQCGRDPMLGRFLSVRKLKLSNFTAFRHGEILPPTWEADLERGQLPSASRAVRSYDPIIDPGFTSFGTVPKKITLLEREQ